MLTAIQKMLKIAGFVVQRLHDVFSYDLTLPSSGSDDVAIFYGDNGSGKTTLLKLMFHMLCHAGDKGHLSAIFRIPFSSAKITLSDGTTISARRDNSPTGLPVNFEINRPDRVAVRYTFVPERFKHRIMEEAVEREFAKVGVNTKKYQRLSDPIFLRRVRETALEHSSEVAHNNYISALKELSLTPYFLGTDRRIISDAIEPWALNKRESDGTAEEEIAKLRASYLRDALGRGARFLSRQIIKASNVGSKNVNDFYAEIIGRIARRDVDELPPESRSLRSVMADLFRLQRRQRRFVRLGLSPDLDVHSFIPDIDTIPDANKLLLEKVLVPYVASLRARLDAMEPIRETVETFVRGLNSFFTFKRIVYQPANGFSIIGPSGGTLEVEQLSSGEQQLLLIFCHVLASNEKQSIFIIDEPEISLNVKWQREILESLSKITRGSENQLMVATHSIELLSQHSDSVVLLDPVISRGKQPIYDIVREED